MNENNSLESLVIPDILLEHLGSRTASREVDADIIEMASRFVEASRLVEADRLVEAGIMDVIKNLFSRGKFKVNYENISTLIKEIETQIANGVKNQKLAPEEQEAAESFLSHLKNVASRTDKGIHSPFRGETKNSWQALQEATERAKTGDYDGLMKGMGDVAGDTADGLKAFRTWGWLESLLNAKDKGLLKQIVPGVKQFTSSGQQVDITFEEFFKYSSRLKPTAIGANPAGDIVVLNKAQLDGALDTLANDIGHSATLKGLAQRAKLVAKATPLALGLGAAAYGVHQVGKNPITTSDFDKAFQGDEYLNQDQKVPPKLLTPQIDNSGNIQSGGLGGTTNGGNFGNLGGQLPNLPNNNKDWLPTNTNSSDYYKIVNNSDSDGNIRLAEENANTSVQVQDPFVSLGNLPSVDLNAILRSVYTAIDQGGVNEQTLLSIRDFVKQEYDKIAPFLNKYEALQSNKNPRIIVSQVSPETIVEVANGAKGLVDSAEKMVNQDHRGESKTKTDSDDFLNNLDIAQKSAYESLAGFGVDIKTAEEWTQSLFKETHMASVMQAVKFIQEVAQIASSASTDVQSVFPVAKNILKRQISSPERAIAILRVIAKYEAMRPGLGLFNLANQAAAGKYNPQELFLIRYSLPMKDGKSDLNSSRDLQQAFDGINMPNTELGKELYEYNKVHQDFQQSQEKVLMRMQRVFLEVQKNREELLTKVMKSWYESIPDWAKNNPIFKSALQFLSGIAYASVIVNTIKHGAGIGGNGLVNPGGGKSDFGFVGSSTRRMRRVLAQAGVAPVDLGAPSAPGTTASSTPEAPTLPPTQQELAAKNIENLNQGKQSNVNDTAVAFGLVGTQLGNRISMLENIFPTLRDTLKANFDNISMMLSSGNQGASQYTKDMAGAAYATSEQIEEYAKGAMKNADDVIGCIIELLKIYNQLSQMQIQGDPTKVAQTKAGLRQKEAAYRTMLAEAQQMRVKIFDISVLGSIDQQVRLLEPQYQELSANIEMMKAFNNVGADAFVMPFASVTQQMAALYFEASRKYQKAAVTMRGEPQMAQYCSQRAKQMQAAGAKARAEGVTALRNLMKQQSGGAVASVNSKFVRLAEETSLEIGKKNVEDGEGDNKEVEAKPMKVDEYWDKLYHENPPYGDVMVHPEKHRNEPSWKMKPKHHIKRLN